MTRPLASRHAAEAGGILAAYVDRGGQGASGASGGRARDGDFLRLFASLAGRTCPERELCGAGLIHVFKKLAVPRSLSHSTTSLVLPSLCHLISSDLPLCTFQPFRLLFLFSCLFGCANCPKQDPASDCPSCIHISGRSHNLADPSNSQSAPD